MISTVSYPLPHILLPSDETDYTTQSCAATIIQLYRILPIFAHFACT